MGQQFISRKKREGLNEKVGVHKYWKGEPGDQANLWCVCE